MAKSHYQFKKRQKELAKKKKKEEKRKRKLEKKGIEIGEDGEIINAGETEESGNAPDPSPEDRQA